MIAAGQTVSLDTTYLEQRLNPDQNKQMFYEIRKITYSDGSENTKVTPVGDTAAVINMFVARSVDRSRRLHANALEVLLKGEKYIQPILQDANALQNQFGFSLLGYLKSQFGAGLVGTWKLRANGAAPIQATVTENAQGNYILNATGISNKQVIPLSDRMFRIQGYPTGKSTDIYLINPSLNIWGDIDRGLIFAK